MRAPLLCLFIALLLGSAQAGDSFFKKGDIVALVGGEDMVAASEYGYLELLLTRALPDYHLRFRSLAWEGDTVFEQRRDLNFPSWEEQLDKIGATVVICQFGQMESLARTDRISEFIAAYEKLVERLAGSGKRRVFLIEPTPIGQQMEPDEYALAARHLAQKLALRSCEMVLAGTQGPMFWTYRDGVHLDEPSHRYLADYLAGRLSPETGAIHERSLKARSDAQSWLRPLARPLFRARTDLDQQSEIQQLYELVVAKNRLWFDYWRVQNWAFLAGDRTNQPSSRDWQDPSKRWFPAEREEFLPLVEAREKEIDELAAKLKSN